MHIFPEEILCPFMFFFSKVPREQTVREPFRNREFPKMSFSREQVGMRQRSLLAIMEEFPALSVMTDNGIPLLIIGCIELTDARRRRTFHRENRGSRRAYLRYAMMPMKRARSTASVSIF